MKVNDWIVARDGLHACRLKSIYRVYINPGVFECDEWPDKFYLRAFNQTTGHMITVGEYDTKEEAAEALQDLVDSVKEAHHENQ